jgi:hypothetical protein
MRTPRRAANRTGTLVLAAVATAVACAGCWYRVEKYCPGCAIVDHTRTAVPAPAAGTHTLVFLVHGARGFGAEWSEVIAWVRRSPGFDLVAWSWPGPFKDPAGDMRALSEELQALVDRLPPSVEEVVLLAHSAGATISNLALRRLHVPAGRHVTVALLDPPPWRPPADLPPDPPLPTGIAATVFYAREAPAAPSPEPAPSTTEGTDLPRTYVGAIGHDPMVAAASLRVLKARRRAKGGT